MSIRDYLEASALKSADGVVESTKSDDLNDPYFYNIYRAAKLLRHLGLGSASYQTQHGNPGESWSTQWKLEPGPVVMVNDYKLWI